jgi:TfoX/Sxy family transcriptional regulator of competence genes
MSTKTQTAEFLVEQLGAGVTAKKMFGEYGLYLDGKIFAMVCDDQLFLKTTPGGRAFLARDGEVKEGPPYPGAKNALIVEAERWDDSEWMAELAAITARELPSPVSKHARAGKRPPMLAPRPARPAAPTPAAGKPVTGGDAPAPAQAKPAAAPAPKAVTPAPKAAAVAPAKPAAARPAPRTKETGARPKAAEAAKPRR